MGPVLATAHSPVDLLSAGVRCQGSVLLSVGRTFAHTMPQSPATRSSLLRALISGEERQNLTLGQRMKVMMVMMMQLLLQKIFKRGRVDCFEKKGPCRCHGILAHRARTVMEYGLRAGRYKGPRALC